MSEAQCRSKNPVMKMVKRVAKEQRDDWPPLKARLFNGSYERFEKIATAVERAIGVDVMLQGW